jgi:hypothetical protein
LSPDDWDESKPVPPGYRVEKRGPVVMMVCGAYTFGLSYAGSVGMAVSNAGDDDVQAAERWMYLPIAGPWITSATLPRRDCAPNCGGLDPYLFLGLGQMVGAGLIAVSPLVEYYTLVPLQPQAVAILPSIERSGAGVSMTGLF